MRSHLAPAHALAACSTPAAEPAPAATAGGAQPRRAETYAISMDRRFAVGERYHEHTSIRSRSIRVIKVSGEVSERETEEYELELSATITITATTDDGRITGYDVEIERLELREGGAAVDVVPPRSRVRVTRVAREEGDGSIELIGGGPLTEAQLDYLDDVFDTSLSMGDDDTFGTDERQAVGDSWPMDTERARRELGAVDMFSDASELTGQTTLAGVTEVDGVRCLQLEAELTMGGFSLPDLPDGARVEHSVLRGTMTGAFPVDPSIRRLRESQELHTTMRVRMPMGPTSTILEVQGEEIETSEYRRLDPASPGTD